MKAKQFILMLLVMLMSVTGAWAQSFEMFASYEKSTGTVEITIMEKSERPRTGDIHKIELRKGDEMVKRGRDMRSLNGYFSWVVGALEDGTYTVFIPQKEYNGWNNNPISATFEMCNCVFDADDFCTKCKKGHEPSKVNGAYQISTLGNLYWYAQNPKANAELVNDIVVNTNLLDADGKPIAANIKRIWTPFFFKGYTFDGKGHSISGLYYSDNEAEEAGFIGTASECVVKNLAIKDSYFHADSHAGGIAAKGYYATFIACHNSSTIETYISAAGGICGYPVVATSISCLNTGKISSERYYAYGISGGNTFSNCVNLVGTAKNVFDTNAHPESTVYEVTAADLSSGQATLLLNGSVTDGTQYWYQKIGTDAMPHAGSNGGDVVYGGYRHGETTAFFTNDPSQLPSNNLHGAPFSKNATTEEAGNHGVCMEYNTCKVCGIRCMHEHHTNGVCDNCNFRCSHIARKFVNGFGEECVICNSNVNIYEPAPKADDGWYEVSNAGQLFWVISEITRNKVLRFRLMNDIVVNENVLNEDGTPCDASAIKHTLGAVTFNGVLDGRGHTISGLHGVALFNWANGATIRNIGIIDSYLHGDRWNASIAVKASKCTITNCYSTATVESSSPGGLVGSSYDTEIRNSYFSGKLIGGEGGLCYTIESTKFIDVCYVTDKLYINNDDEADSPYWSVVNNCVHLNSASFASGDAAFKMNKGKTDGTQLWYQKIGTDKSPVLLSKGGDTVYEKDVCTGAKGYANTSTLPAGNHVYDEETERCLVCMQGKPAPLSADGYYELSSVGNLFWFASQTTSSPSINARLMNDIVLNEDMSVASKKRWVSIHANYSGTFDGQGHVISGLYDDALFGGLNDGARISRLGVVNSVFLTAASNGVFGTTVRGATISECYIHNVTQENGAGIPLVGDASRNSKIESCFVYNTTNSAIATKTDNCTITDSYVLDGTGAAIVTGSTTGNTTITNSNVADATKFANGEVAYRLNKYVSDGSQAWYQDVDADALPGLQNNGGNTVLYVRTCKTTNSYENYPAAADGHVYTFRTDRYYHLMCKHCGHTFERNIVSYYHAGRVSAVAEKTIDGVTYTLYNNYVYLQLDGNFHATSPLRRVYDKCCVATINGAEGNVVIPATVTFNADYTDVPVVIIGVNEAKSSHQVTSLTLPKSVSVMEDENYLYFNGDGIKDIYVSWTDAKEVAETEFANGFLESGTHYLHIPEGSDEFLRDTKWIKRYGFRFVLEDFAEFKESLHALVNAQMAEMYDGETYRPAVVQYADDIHARIDQMTDYTMTETTVYPLLDNLFATFRQDQQNIVEDAKMGLNIDLLNTFVDPYLAQMGASADAAEIRRTRDEALEQIAELLDVYSKGISNKQNANEGVRLKVKMGEVSPIEINANEVKTIEFYRATE